ncbi:MAG: phytase [Calditrichaeota bacterium]|nr:phytase [Calditrichota bacterium]
MKFLIIPIILLTACSKPVQETFRLQPKIVTESVSSDSDDPAIWYNKNNPEQSLILGTDKGKENGGLYVFNLNGKIDRKRSITGLKRPNNVDIEYGFNYQGKLIDIAVVTERNRDMIRVFSLPEMTALDNGGIPVFVSDSNRSPMGIALYTDGSDIYAFVSRKTGKSGSYIWQYLLSDSDGQVIGHNVRRFGEFSGKNEIESIAVDDSSGVVFYSDEGYGVRAYWAASDAANEQLMEFATNGFTADHEGISIYPTDRLNGYILVSDQQANSFHVFNRSNPREELAILPVSTNESDGSDSFSGYLNAQFPNGIFVAMSDNKTFQIYDWRDIEAFISKQQASKQQ